MKNNYINILKGKSEKEVLSSLKGLGNELTPFEKNLIYVYLFPKPLKDRELITVLQDYRKQNGNERGSLEKDENEVLILLRAYRTSQYRRYMKHLLIAYVKNEDKVMVIDGQEREICGVCGKPLYQHKFWEIQCSKVPGYGEQDRKEYLALGTLESSQCMCLDCLTQLKYLNELLTDIEGPNYLHNRL